MEESGLPLIRGLMKSGWGWRHRDGRVPNAESRGDIGVDSLPVDVSVLYDLLSEYRIACIDATHIAYPFGPLPLTWS